MSYFKFSDAKSLSEYINQDSKGLKFGEKVITVSALEELQNYETEYVLFGIPRLSNSTDDFEIVDFDMFQEVLKNLLNIQNNQFNRGENLIILGELDVEVISKEISELKTNSEKRKLFHNIVEITIYEIVHAICNSGKIPIVIDGHHKDTFDILKVVSTTQNHTANLLDLSTQLNLVFEKNTDQLVQNKAYYDTEIINKHHTFGLHKNYISQEELEILNSFKNLNFHFYEDCLHLTTLDKCIRFKNAVDFLNRKLGFKLDFRSIQGMSSHCDSSSGFSVRDIRTFLKVIRKEQTQFVHICGFESDFKQNIGQTLSYFISDFMRSDD